MAIEYLYSTLKKPLSFTEHSPAEQVEKEPTYDKTNVPTDPIYTQTPCIP